MTRVQALRTWRQRPPAVRRSRSSRCRARTELRGCWGLVEEAVPTQRAPWTAAPCDAPPGARSPGRAWRTCSASTPRPTRAQCGWAQRTDGVWCTHTHMVQIKTYELTKVEFWDIKDLCGLVACSHMEITNVIRNELFIFCSYTEIYGSPERQVKKSCFFIYENGWFLFFAICENRLKNVFQDNFFKFFFPSVKTFFSMIFVFTLFIFLFVKTDKTFFSG